MEPMGKSKRANRYSTEVRARAVRMVFEHEHEYANQSSAIMAIAPKIGCGRDTLRRWVKQSDIDSDRKDGQTSDDRAKRDVVLSPEVKRVWEENNEVYGIRKIWHQLQREKFTIARCTVARLMKLLDIHGVIRGKAPKTTVQDKRLPCPEDKVNRKFRAPAPNMLWVSDFTHVSTWQGFAYVAFIIDTFADKIVGWRVSRSLKTDFVLGALEQALHDRRPAHKGGLIHHSPSH